MYKAKLMIDPCGVILSDHLLLRCLREGMKPEEIEERLFLSDSGFRYRLKKLNEASGCASRSEFLVRLKEWEEYL